MNAFSTMQEQKVRLPTVLCIDDDPDVSSVIEIYMRRFAVNVVRALHGTEGLAQALRLEPDVIVMDISMPHGDGASTLESLRSNVHTASIPVIILSGSRDQKEIRKVINLGCSRVMRKPALLEELASEIACFVTLRSRETKEQVAMGDAYANYDPHSR